jgi:hypothetical protein
MGWNYFAVLEALFWGGSCLFCVGYMYSAELWDLTGVFAEEITAFIAARRRSHERLVSKWVNSVTLPVFCRKRAEEGVARCSGLSGDFDGCVARQQWRCWR